MPRLVTFQAPYMVGTEAPRGRTASYRGVNLRTAPLCVHYPEWLEDTHTKLLAASIVRPVRVHTF